mgnify:CR=1 FL=1
MKKDMEEASNAVLFEIKVLEKQYDLTDPEAKTQFFREISRKLLEFPEELERNNYMESISRIYQIKVEDLRKMVNNMALGGTSMGTVKRAEARASKKREQGGCRSYRAETDAHLADLLPGNV